MTSARLIPMVFVLACDSAASDRPPPEVGPSGRPVLGTCPEPAGADSDPFADCVDEIAAAEGASFGHDQLPDIVLGPPQGGGENTGGMHVASLGCGGDITLRLDPPGIVDRPGPDLIVFENAFESPQGPFVEPGIVLISADGIDFYAFACDPLEAAEGCAGVAPVLANGAQGATDPETAGGDAFDLAEVGLTEAAWVRIVDRTREHYGMETWCLGSTGGFDLDAVAAVGGP